MKPTFSDFLEPFGDFLEPFSDFLEQCRERVEKNLTRLLPEPAGAAAGLLQAMHYSVFNGGKRVRPILAYASAAAIDPACLSPPPADTIADLDRVACALECIHAYSLIHDDLPAMDNDDLRRGKPTCHIAFGEAAAILAGDALQCLAFEQLARLHDTSAETGLALVRQLATAAGAAGMAGGQAIDLAAVNQALSLPALEHMHNHKTGALIRASVAMGAQLAGAGESQLEALDHYARAIGLAFQVQDDILDVTATTDALGKRQGADQALNKPTYVSLLGLEGARQKAQALHREALAALNEFGANAEHLRALSGYIVERGN